MPKRLTHDYVSSEIEKAGYELLSNYEYAQSEILVKCPNNHKYKSTWDRFNSGKRCPNCKKPSIRRLTIEYVREETQKAGYQLLSTKYLNSLKKLLFLCNKGHKYKACWGNFQQGRRCPYCAGRIINLDVARQRVEEAGYKLLSEKYINDCTKLRIQCDQGHIYKANLNNFTNGSRCPYCAGHIVDYATVKRAIEKTGYKLISKSYINNLSKLTVECNHQHEYEVSWSNFQKGKRCPVCSGNLITYEIIKKKIEDCGFTLLSDTYVNCGTHLKIKCDQGHTYKKPWTIFQTGIGCPTCNYKGGFNKNEPGSIYYAKIKIGDRILYKIGVTNRPVLLRLTNCERNPYLQRSKVWMNRTVQRSFS